MNATAPVLHGGEVISLAELLGRIWAGRWLVAICIVVFGGGFTAAAFLIKPVYRASAVLVSGSQERAGLSGTLSSALGSLGGLAALAGVSVGSGDASTEEALAVLRSRQFTERFIGDNKLMPVLFAAKWDSAKSSWKTGSSKQPTSAAGFKYFDSMVRSVSQDRKTGLVTINVDWIDPDTAALWANQLVARLNAEMRSRAILKADASLGFLQKELGGTTVLDTRSAINRLIESQINQRMLASVTQEFAFRVVDHAMAPDRNDVIRPKKIVLIGSGLLLGLVIGLAGAVLLRRTI